MESFGILLILFKLVLQIGANGKDVYIPSDDVNHVNCAFEPNTTKLFCNFTDTEKVVHVVPHVNSTSIQLTILGANMVRLNNSPSGYSSINISNSRGLEAYSSSNNNSPYALHLYKTTALDIKENVKNFKCEYSSIEHLELLNTNEFEIISSKINTFKGKSVTLSPSIISSTIENMELSCDGNSKLKISNTNINVLKLLNHNSINISSIELSKIKYIHKHAVNITLGELIVNNTSFEITEDEAFIIEKGRLIFDNTTSNIRPNLVNMKPEGFFQIRTHDDTRTYVVSFDLETKGNDTQQNTFSPLSKIMLTNSTKLVFLIVIGLLCLVVMVFITLMLIFMYRKHKLKDFPNILVQLGEPERRGSSNVDLNNGYNKYLAPVHPQTTSNTEDQNSDMHQRKDSYDYSDSNPKMPINQQDSYCYSEPAPAQKHLLNVNLPAKPGMKYLDHEQDDYFEPQVNGEQLEDYSEPEWTHNMSTQISSNELIYSDTNYPTESIHKIQQKPINNNRNLNISKAPPGKKPSPLVKPQENGEELEDYSEPDWTNNMSNQISTNELIYSDSSYPTESVHHIQQNLMNNNSNLNIFKSPPGKKPSSVQLKPQLPSKPPTKLESDKISNKNNSSLGPSENASFLSRNKNIFNKLTSQNLSPLNIHPSLPAPPSIPSKGLFQPSRNQGLPQKGAYPPQVTEEEEEDLYEEYEGN